MTVVKVMIESILKVFGVIVVIIGQGLNLIEPVSGLIMNIMTGSFLITALIITFSDTLIFFKIMAWGIVVILRLIITHIGTLTEVIHSLGLDLMNYKFK